jgi:hypothetical protein
MKGMAAIAQEYFTRARHTFILLDHRMIGQQQLASALGHDQEPAPGSTSFFKRALGRFSVITR